MKTTMKMETPDNMSRRQFISSAVAAATCMGLPSLCWGDDLPQSENWTAELARHRFARIEQRTVTVKWPRLVGKNAFHDVHGRGQSYSVVVLHTDRGATGWGMGGFGRDKTVADQLRKQLKGKSVVELFAPAVGILPGGPGLRPARSGRRDLESARLRAAWRELAACDAVLQRHVLLRRPGAGRETGGD